MNEISPQRRSAVVPGSYDPITNGHVDVITRATSLFDEVIVAVVAHSVRKSRSLFSLEERLEFISIATAHLPTVRAAPFDTLVVDLARREAPEIESVYLMASPQYSFLRSSGVKELATFGGNIDDLVPDYVAARLKEELGR